MSVELLHLNYRTLPKERQNVSEIFTFEGRWYGWQSGRHTGSLLQLSETEFAWAQAKGWKLVADHDQVASVQWRDARHAAEDAEDIANGVACQPRSELLDCRECRALMHAFDPPFARDLCARCAAKAGLPKPCNHHWTNMAAHACLWCKMPRPEGAA